MFTRFVALGCQQFVRSGVAEIDPLVAQELVQLAATAMLETFTSTTMTADYMPGPGWVSPGRFAADYRSVRHLGGVPVGCPLKSG